MGFTGLAGLLGAESDFDFLLRAGERGALKDEARRRSGTVDRLCFALATRESSDSISEIMS